jgi:amino acid adenylation domain-containing protein
MMHRALEALVAALETEPSRPIGSLDVLPQAERRRVVEEFNATAAPFPDGRCVHELFEARVRETPDAPAVVFPGGMLTYGELNRRANRLAHHLRALGVGPDSRVAIHVERGPEMIVGVVAVLKAGGAYVPLDPSYPPERLRYMLEDSEPAVVLTQESLADSRDALLEGIVVPAVSLDAVPSSWDDEPETDLALGGLTPAHLAWVIYTSGSTGRPKGVMVAHRGACNLVTVQAKALGATRESRILQFASFSFDGCAFEIVMALGHGASLHLLPAGEVPVGEALTEVVESQGVTHAIVPPPVLAALPETTTLPSLRTLASVGDVLPPAVQARWGAGRRFINGYGPTEATVATTIFECGAPGAESPPIGGPVPNARVYILDPSGRPAPVGVVGELHVGGVGLARGYLNRPAMTAERFVPDALGGRPGGRLYRTGDLGRWLPDGTIEFAGRNDAQVKVRGFRIELGEIEARLADHRGVREAVVLVRDDGAGKRLVAYYVGEAELDAGALRAHLSERLPEYLVPAAFVRLDALPLTPNGKLDRRGLPAPDAEAWAAQEYEAPVGEAETALAEIWCEVLGVDRVGRRDNFFELGGHSLSAVTLVERMRRRGLHCEVRALFNTPTLAELAAQAGGESHEVAVPANLIPDGCRAITPEMLPLVELDAAEIGRIAAGVPGGAANVQDIYPLAPLQEGMLFHHLLTHERDPYVTRVLGSFETRGELDAYLNALQQVIARHDILRTAIVWEGLREPVQVVWRQARLEVEEIELDPAADAEEELYARFDPRDQRVDVRRAPMLRAWAAYDAKRDRWLLLELRHHLSGDHTTLAVMKAEVRAILAGQGDRLAAPLPFRNYVAQARLGISRDEHETFFRGLLGDVTQPTAPFGLLDAQGDGSGIERGRLQVERGLAGRLRERARALGVSAASICHVAWGRVLAGTTGREDVVFGTLLFGRMGGGAGADRVMGLFINTLPVRVRDDAAGAEAAVRAMHAQLADLLRHEHAPLALAQRCSGVEAPAPLFTSLLNYRHTAAARQARAAEPAQAAGGMRTLRSQERTNYPVVMAVDDLGDFLGLTSHAPASLGPDRLCALMHRALEGVVSALETAPELPARSIDILPAAERRTLVETWNATGTEYPSESCLHERFEAQAERAPDAVAVEFDGGTVTYGELNARANRLARHLRTLGVGPDTRVAIAAERSPEMVAGLLAVLKAGGAYVPLDPEYPADRLDYMLEDSAPAVLLTQRALEDRFVDSGVRRVLLDADPAPWAAEDETNPERRGVTAGHLAYVIYTSGSTGRPKGVMNLHRNVVNRLCWGQSASPLGAGDAVLQGTSLSFDVATREIFWALLSGARLVLPPPGGQRDPAYLAATIRERGITTLNLVPSLLQVLVEEPQMRRCTGLARIVCSGEALPAPVLAAARERLPWAEITNIYGPSEAATGVATVGCEPEAGRGIVAIGRPTANVRAYVLDAEGRIVPIGVEGELYLGGHGVARGYHLRPALTAERFVPDPFGPAGDRLYRTGDLARWRADGTLEFLGRNDQQVKVRGFRIETGEIEALLSAHPAVREAAVVAREDAPGDRRLVAYVAGEVDFKALRARLAARLPEYMVPAAFVRLDEMPRTPNGKLDRRALPAPGAQALSARGYEAPADETEEELAAIWAEVLGAARVGRHDHFFELGGHSLLAVKMVSRVRQELDIDIPLGDVFEHPTLAAFAQQVVEAELAQFDPGEIARLAALLQETGD